MKDIQCTAIIPAAGRGTRMNKKKLKQYIELNNKPILVYTLQAFEKCNNIDNIILVVGEKEVDYCIKEIVEKYKFRKIIYVIKGGNERQNSVYEGLRHVPDSTDIVLIHDGARPFINEKHIKETIGCAYKNGACVLGVPVKDTIKVINDNIIVDTPKRDSLWSIQTPQTFKRELIKSSYEKAIKDKYVATDDSMIVEKYSDINVKIVEGSYANMKITTNEDLIIAKSFITNGMTLD
ncbi:MAG: 2-C-methyl-D-erythritol 4-phosphate cytidylyltransferase [Vallitalea sp.]|jgi:2-C-methyl-D-erythritol 4-phosphate cytidylyltransferase|nr:2-C-methyl-D-erythritol 4-phosphate cytidylyltransferase [Vallitalea sp.]